MHAVIGCGKQGFEDVWLCSKSVRNLCLCNFVLASFTLGLSPLWNNQPLSIYVCSNCISVLNFVYPHSISKYPSLSIFSSLSLSLSFFVSISVSLNTSFWRVSLVFFLLFLRALIVSNCNHVRERQSNFVYEEKNCFPFDNFVFHQSF